MVVIFGCLIGRATPVFKYLVNINVFLGFLDGSFGVLGLVICDLCFIPLYKKYTEVLILRKYISTYYI
jgi:hypothetical protein